MTDSLIRHHATRCALVYLLMLIWMPNVQGGFAVSINGTQVASDNGVGDLDSEIGVIRYLHKIDGYKIRLTTVSETSSATDDFAISELRIKNKANRGSLSAPLVVTITETFGELPGFHGGLDLTKDTVAGLGTSGTVTSTTSEVGQSGAQAQPGEVSSSDRVGSGTSSGSFERTAEEFRRTQTINVAGLLGSNAVLITTAGSTAESGGSTGGPGESLLLTPAPSPLALLAVGLALVGIYQLRPNQWRPRI